jgi:hypothetical protein
MVVYTGPGAPPAELRVNAAGNAVHARNLQVKVNGSLIYDQPMNYYDYRKVDESIPNSLIASGNANIEMINGGSEPTDRMVVAKAELIYPRRFDITGWITWFYVTGKAAGNYLR